MLQLDHLLAPTFYVDATQRAADVAKRVKRLLGSKVFRILNTTMEGMEHLLPGQTMLTSAEGIALAQKLHLNHYSVDPRGLARLSRVAAVIKENPAVVNTQLQPSDAQHYY